MATTIVITPEQAAALPVGTVLTAGHLTARKDAGMVMPGRRPGWMVEGFLPPLRPANTYWVVERTLFRYAPIWTAEES
jgi:hypothetical protein